MYDLYVQKDVQLTYSTATGDQVNLTMCTTDVHCLPSAMNGTLPTATSNSSSSARVSCVRVCVFLKARLAIVTVKRCEPRHFFSRYGTEIRRNGSFASDL